MSQDSNLRSFAAFAVLFGASTLFPGCASTKQSVGLENVDSLVSRVEQVHLETELSRQAVYSAILALGPLFAKDFNGDATVSFEAFAQATEACEKQANELRAHVSPMRNSATSVFQRWEKSLDDFSSPNMKQRSSDRLESTRERFAEVQEDAVLAQTAFDELNGQLRDTVLFLGHDFNSTSVAEIEEDAFAIRDRARELGRTFDNCMDAAAEYVEKSALRGQAQGHADITVSEK
ncbi:MAG: hypothetical protein ACJAZN_000669 [Planctomycetota bacterium]|jgi:hypothetical protein